MPRARIHVKEIRKLLALTYENDLGLRDAARVAGVSKSQAQRPGYWCPY